MSSEFSKKWFFRWAEGTIKGYLRHRIELNRAKGMLKTAINNIGEEKISLIFKNIMENQSIYQRYLLKRKQNGLIY